MSCSLCTARPSVSCCGQKLCVMDAFSSLHAHHQPRWAISNRALYNLELPAVLEVRNEVIKELEDELEAMASAPLAEAAAAPTIPPRPLGTIRRTSLPSSPAAAEIAKPSPVAVPLSFNDITKAASEALESKKRRKQARSSLPPPPVPTLAEPAEESSDSAPDVAVDPVPFPPDVMRDQGRKKALSLFLRTLREHGEHRAAAFKAAKRAKAALPTPAPVKMAGPALVSVAIAIEAALYTHHTCVESAYFSHVKSLVSHLNNRNNPELHHRVCNGEITPSQLILMSDDELGGEALRRYKQELAAEAEKLITLSSESVWEASELCPVCGSKDSVSNTLATLRDIRKAEVWGSKHSAAVMTVTCRSCSHSWTVET